MNQVGLIHDLDVRKIAPNPDNPRKELGDITELSKSIKKNGIMQNLTVVPVDDDMEEFMLLIGHRRFAAAKEAGFKKVPCVIVEGLTQREQIAIMLEENVQRSDLTISEQAESFQMMIDLGENVETLVQKTGFSESTIRHRLKLVELDKDILKIKTGTKNNQYQVSLTDLYKLEQVDDIEERNKILKIASSAQEIENRIYRYKKDKEDKERREVFVKIFEELGLKKAPKNTNYWDSKYDRLLYLNLTDDPEEKKEKIKSVMEKENDKCIYLEQYSSFYILQKHKKTKKETEAEKEQKETRAKKELLEVAQKRIDQQRKKWILEKMIKLKLSESEEMELITYFINFNIDNDLNLDPKEIRNYIKNRGMNWDDLEPEEIAELKKLPKSIYLLIAADNLIQRGYNNLFNYDLTIDKNEAKKYNDFYNILSKCGYEKDDTETKLLDGTHELYKKEENYD